MKRPSVLIIENNYLDIFVIRALIGKYIDVFVVKSFEEAIKINSKFNFDMVLVDMTLFNRENDNLNLRILKETGKNVDLKICALSGLINDSEPISKRFDHSIQKPLTKEDIFNVLNWDLSVIKGPTKHTRPKVRTLAAIF